MSKMKLRFLYAFVAIVFCVSVAIVCAGTANAKDTPPGWEKPPPGWEHGKKTGWGGGSYPPGSPHR